MGSETTAVVQSDEAPLSREERLLLRLEVDEFNARYAAILDRGDLNEWPAQFTEQAVYKITSQENFDAGLPMGLMYCDSRGMFQDRVYAILNTTVFSPRNIVHFVTNVEIQGVQPSGSFAAQSNFLLVENIIDRNPRLLMAGRYIDKFARVDGRLLLEERLCVYDTLTIQISVIYPV
jgi:anthranilate 1,2-dioxygenase small subunit